jgi:hypothetical protein
LAYCVAPLAINYSMAVSRHSQRPTVALECLFLPGD